MLSESHMFLNLIRFNGGQCEYAWDLLHHNSVYVLELNAGNELTSPPSYRFPVSSALNCWQSSCLLFVRWGLPWASVRASGYCRPFSMYRRPQQEGGWDEEARIRLLRPPSQAKEGDPGLIPGLGKSAGEGIGYPFQYSWASIVAQLVKKSACNAENWGLIPGLGRSSGEEKGYPL